MFQQIAAMALLCIGVLAASNGAERSLWADTNLPLELPEKKHHLKFTPPSVSFSALLREGIHASDQNNDRRTVCAFAKYWSVSPIVYIISQ